MICSLQRSTAPALRPLVLVNAGVTATEREHLQLAGAEVIEAPPLPPWNQSGTLWAERPSHLRRHSAPPRLEQFYKLQLWDPAVSNAQRLVYIDPDALVLRNVSTLLTEVAAPAALAYTDRCAQNLQLWQPRGGIVVDGVRVAKCQYYWNAGVLVFEPNASLYTTLMELYASGRYPNADPGCYASEQDLLQYVFWRELGGQRVNSLVHGDNFRGMECSYEAVGAQADIRIVHKSEHTRELVHEACSNGNTYAKALFRKGNLSPACPALPQCRSSSSGDASFNQTSRAAVVAAGKFALRVHAHYGSALSCSRPDAT